MLHGLIQPRQAIVVSMLFLLPALPAHGQDRTAAQRHVLHVLESHQETPEGQGILPVAIQEATIALEHARLAAGGDPTDDGPMRTHANHVLHAVHPSAGTSGPGLGFGLKRAADGIVQHIEMAMTAEGTSENIRTHGAAIAAAAREVSGQASEIVALADQVQATGSGDYMTVHSIVREMQTVSELLIMGLEDVERHLEHLAAGEGLR